MTDVDHPKMAGSGVSEDDGVTNNQEVDVVTVKKHKRAHSRNKSISGRQDFIDEITNGNEFTKDKTDNVPSEPNITEAPLTLSVLGNGKELQNDVQDRSKIAIDETDALPEGLRYNWFDLLCTMISILTYVLDVVMDCVVAYYFYHLAVDHGIYHYWYFGLTIFFIVMPSLTMTGFSFRWYLMDNDNTQLPAVGTCRWILRLLILLFQIAPILRYLDSIRYGLLSRCARSREERAPTQTLKDTYRKERVKWYTLMVYEDADATLLRLYESFMESAPQLVLQLYILLKDPHASRIYPYKPPRTPEYNHEEDQYSIPGINPYFKLSILVMSITSSLISLAWSLVVYHRSLRYTYPHKKNISLLGTLFQFLWHFCSITARVVALSLFASVLPKWIGPLCAGHWVVMASWVVWQRTAACNTRCEEFLFALVLGMIYIFMFFNAKEERTRYKYLLYYTFCLLENSAIIAIWFLSDKTNRTDWYVFPAMTGHYLAFFAGIFFMICYYLWFHPTGVEVPFLRPPRDKVVNPEETVESIRLTTIGDQVESQEHPDGIQLLPHDRGSSLPVARDSPIMGPLGRFLSDNSDKVAVRRSSSVPVNQSVIQEGPLSGARKLKYMGHNKVSDV